MIVEKTDRMIMKSKMFIEDGRIISNNAKKIGVSLLNLKPNDILDGSFVFYDMDGKMQICIIEIRRDNKPLELRYETAEKYRNKGYMSEAVRFLSDWIFGNTAETSIWASVADNESSKKVLLNAGFEFEEIDANRENGEWFIKQNCNQGGNN